MKLKHELVRRKSDKKILICIDSNYEEICTLEDYLYWDGGKTVYKTHKQWQPSDRYEFIDKFPRKLQSGREVVEEDKEVKMEISSKCPDKWLFVDLETGDVWHKRENETNMNGLFWRGANKTELKELKNLKV